MLNWRNHTRNGDDWNPMPDMELESLRGVRIFGRGFAKRWVRTNPANPIWSRACLLPSCCSLQLKHNLSNGDVG